MPASGGVIVVLAEGDNLLDAHRARRADVLDLQQLRLPHPVPPVPLHAPLDVFGGREDVGQQPGSGKNADVAATETRIPQEFSGPQPEYHRLQDEKKTNQDAVMLPTTQYHLAEESKGRPMLPNLILTRFTNKQQWAADRSGERPTL